MIMKSELKWGGNNHE